jgi:hypothetical protein
MPLVKTSLVNGLRKFMDAQYSSFDAFPAKENDAITAIIDAVDQYASNVTPMSKTASTAKSAMQETLTGMGGANQAISKIQDGFTQYVTLLATGMIGSPVTAPAGAIVSTSIAPSGKIPIDAVGNIGLNGGSSEDVANLIGTIADTWFKTGMTMVTLPNGTTATGPTWL